MIYTTETKTYIWKTEVKFNDDDIPGQLYFPRKMKYGPKAG